MKGLLFTYLMTYGGAVVALFNPFVGLLIYVCFAIIKPDALWFWSVPPGNYSRTIAIALLLGWAIRGFGRWQFGRARSIISALIGFWLWAVLGAIQAPNQDVAWRFVDLIGKIVLPVLVGMTTIHSVRQLKQLAWVIFLSQGYLAYEFNLSYFQGYNRLHWEGFGGSDNNCAAVGLVAGVGLAFFLGIGATRRWQKALAFGVAALMIHAVLFSFSRGGMLGLIVTGVAAFLLIPKKLKHYLIFIMIVILSLQLAGQEVRERFSTIFASEGERDASAQSRLDLWKDCVDAMIKQPAFGVGPGHWPLVVHEYGWTTSKVAHTLWLEVGAELGVPALLCLIWFYGYCMARLWPLTWEESAVADPWLRDAARMVIAALSGFIVSSQFVSIATVEIPYYVTLIGAGILKLMFATSFFSMTSQQGEMSDSIEKGLLSRVEPG